MSATFKNVIKKIPFAKTIKNYFDTKNQDHWIGSDYTKKKIVSANYFIGDYTYGLPEVIDSHHDSKLIIGKFCSFGRGILILLCANHPLKWPTTYPLALLKGVTTPSYTACKGDITIGNDVWVGSNSTIMSGITIGNGAVIGAGAVVTKDVPPYAIVAGNPAKLIRFRFSQDKIDHLQQLQWWNWDVETIKNNINFLTSDYTV